MIIKKASVKNIMTKSNLPVSDFSVNPYIGCAHACKYCYASFMKRFTNHKEPWGKFVDVKYWPDIKNLKIYENKEVFLGSVTDCYQPCEAKYKRTRALLEQLQGGKINITIATKSDLVLRDIDLIKTFSTPRVAFSINTLDDNFRREMDSGVSIERRLAAMKKFYEAKIESVCFISPIFPGITDVKAIIERVKGQCNLIWLENLNLRGDYKAKIIAWVHKNYSTLDKLYSEIYTNGKCEYWQKLDQEIREYTLKENMPYLTNSNQRSLKFGQPPIVVNYFYHKELVKK